MRTIIINTELKQKKRQWLINTFVSCLARENEYMRESKIWPQVPKRLSESIVFIVITSVSSVKKTNQGVGDGNILTCKHTLGYKKKNGSFLSLMLSQKVRVFSLPLQMHVTSVIRSIKEIQKRGQDTGFLTDVLFRSHAEGDQCYYC